MSQYGYDTPSVQSFRPRDEATLTRRERRRAFVTILIYHVDVKPTLAERFDRLQRLHLENGCCPCSLGVWDLVAGTTRRITHTPAGYRGIPISFQSEMRLT